MRITNSRVSKGLISKLQSKFIKRDMEGRGNYMQLWEIL